MNVPAKLGIYGLGLVLAFGGAAGVGRLVGPLGPADAASAERDDGHTASGSAGTESVPEGLQVSEGDYTLDLLTAPKEAGEEAKLSFRITGPDGAPVTDFAVVHEQLMHVIVVGRDADEYHHLHPEMDDDGVWSVPAELDTPGPYRMFADFVPEGDERGDSRVLGADIAIEGEYRPVRPPEPAATAQIDGYVIDLDGQLTAGRPSELTFTVTKDGEPVTDLQPVMGVYGHVVALRDGDLAYTHVHPRGEPGDGTTKPGPDVTFAAQVPTPGTYRLYLDFRHDGKVRTAEFTAVAGDTGGTGGRESGH
ncbi:hypothetical protein CDO52_26665 [Nocardiopsis gilva YIM 90087]|uniref:Heavy metal-binding domain-containing protein n=1 Tax=Nocardiopsis gilva YIM 90087 TaxID=1235441 RepID=A0A223SCU0_9ACTN|nr:hypothetical protein [Nocardiopsis gilva]ASU85905.1 hypothetical protein CDO52_26665 [Nocardiopsis gilva YIM 90087]